MTQEHDIRQAYINTLLDGGFTRLADGSINPTEGYIVGGVIEPTTMYSTCSPNPTIHYAQFQELWRKYDLQLDEYTSNLYEAVMGVGTWIYKNRYMSYKIYFDLVQHISDLDRATEVAKERGEIAIYDCTNQKEILL